MPNQTSPQGLHRVQNISGTAVTANTDDFLPIPAKRLAYRGLDLSRSSILRLVNAGEVLVAKLRVSGRRQGRTYLIRESLDAWVSRELRRPENSQKASAPTA